MGIGKDSYWQVAEESSPGTFAPATAKSEMISEGVGIEIDEIPDPSLYAGRSIRGIYQGARRFKGPLVVRMNYEGATLKLLKSVLGSSSTALVGGETIVRDITIKESAGGAALPTLSFEFSKGDIPTSKVLRGTGALVSKLTMSGGVGTDAMCRMEAELLGIDLDPNTGATPAGYSPTTTIVVTGGGGSGGNPTVTTSSDFIAAGVRPGMPISGTGIGAGAEVLSITNATTLTATVNNSGAVSGSLTFTLDFPNLLPIIGTQVITLNDGVDANTYPGGTGRIRHWQVTLENSLAERLYLGSAQPDTPLPDNFFKATWEFQQEYQTLKQYQAARLYTDTAPKIVLQDSATIGSTSKHEFEIHSNQARCKYSNPVEGYGVVLATATHTAYYNATDASSVLVRVRSLDAAA